MYRFPVYTQHCYNQALKRRAIRLKNRILLFVHEVFKDREEATKTNEEKNEETIHTRKGVSNVLLYN